MRMDISRGIAADCLYMGPRFVPEAMPAQRLLRLRPATAHERQHCKP